MELSDPGATVAAMSDRTAQEFEAAKAVEGARQAEAASRKRELLAAIACGIPAYVDAIAKREAHGQPDVARRLGSDGIRVLRKELGEAAAALASEVEMASDQIKWPTAYIAVKDVRAAVFDFLHGSRVDRIAAVLERHGFDIYDDNMRNSQFVVLPQHLYDEGLLAPVTEVLRSLAKAKEAVAVAKAADDKAVIDSFWAD